MRPPPGATPPQIVRTSAPQADRSTNSSSRGRIGRSTITTGAAGAAAAGAAAPAAAGHRKHKKAYYYSAPRYERQPIYDSRYMRFGSLQWWDQMVREGRARR